MLRTETNKKLSLSGNWPYCCFSVYTRRYMHWNIFFCVFFNRVIFTVKHMKRIFFGSHQLFSHILMHFFHLIASLLLFVFFKNKINLVGITDDLWSDGNLMAFNKCALYESIKIMLILYIPSILWKILFFNLKNIVSTCMHN